MAIESPARASGRPRPWLVGLLGVLAVVLLWQMFSGGTPAPTVPTRENPRAAKPADQIEPADLDVKIETLGDQPAGLSDAGRNPFRFEPKAAPPAPAPSPGPARPVTPPAPYAAGPPPPPPGPPAIGTLIKFIGIVDTGKEKIGAFSDCRTTFSGRAGEIMEGRFRLVEIGVESATVEYVDGTGRTRLPLNGQACVK